MERLTYFKDGYWRVNFSGVQYQADFVDRLAAYEDTGLSPEKVSWMKEVVEAAFDNDTSRIERAHNLHVADKEGRVVVLPCKVGDTVYFALLGRIIEKQVFSIVSFSKSTRIYCGGTSEYFRPEDIGKIFFLTREEAEKALQEMEDKKDGKT